MSVGNALRQTRRTGVLLLALSLISFAPAASMRKKPVAGTAEANAASRYGQLPLSFEENRGQTDKNVQYLSRGTGYTLFLTGKDAVLSLTTVDKNQKSQATAIRLGFAGSTGAQSVEGSDLQAGVSNYMTGADRSKWMTGLKHYGRVNYKSVYPGVDAVFYGNQRQLEYDFVVAPGADTKQIRLSFDGAKGVRVNENGELVLKTELGDLVQGRPVAYQTINGQRKLVDAKYAMRGSEVAFTLARYDRTQPLVIDPTLQWTTYLGGTGLDYATGIAVDPSRNVYVSGYTSSTTFPAGARFGGGLGGASDAFVVKYSADGKTMLWSTFLAGEALDQATSVVANASGVTVVGYTESTNFPTINNRQSIYGGNGDAFVAKIAAAGDKLLYSTYIGGLQQDVANDVTLDGNGGAVFVGTSASTNFSPVGPSFGGTDAFVVRMLPDGSDYVYRFLIGSQGNEAGFGVAADSTNNVYITGRTNSIFFQGTPGAVQGGIANPDKAATDAFVQKIDASGGTVWRTLLGGSADDEGISVAFDSASNVYVFGNTQSANFVTTPGALRTTALGNGDTFVVKLNPSATARTYSTYFGGTGIDTADKIIVNQTTGVAFLFGTTTSTDFPLVAPVQLSLQGASDVFVSELNIEATALNNSTVFGGSGIETSGSMAMDATGNLYLAGTTTSGNLPLTTGQAQATLSGTQDAFVVKLSNCVVTLLPASANISAAAGTGSIAISGAADCAWTAQSSDPSFLTIVGAAAGSGNGTLSFNYTQNNSAPRSAFIQISNQRFTINQAGAPLGTGGCVYPFQNPADVVDAGGVTRTVTIGTLTSGCAWEATSNAPWLIVSPGSGTGTGVLTYVVTPNFGTFNKVGVITVRDLSVNATSTLTVTITPNAFLNADARLVTLLYFNLLGRYPSPAEIFQQTASGLTREAIAYNIITSPEFNARSRFTAGLYLGLLDRIPEYTGWTYQRNALATGQFDQLGLVNNFLNSPEYSAKWGVQSNQDYVTFLYVKILGRLPSQNEIDLQVGALTANPATGRRNMAFAFLTSPEFQQQTTNRVMAWLLYGALLGRDPSGTEYTDRVFHLSVFPLSKLVSDVIQSTEMQLKLQ